MIHFEGVAKGNERIFTVKFPLDAMMSIKWDIKELAKMTKYDDSDLVSYKLKMLAMIADKLELETEAQYNLVEGEKDEQK